MIANEFNAELYRNLQALKADKITEFEYSRRIANLINASVASLIKSGSMLTNFSNYEQHVITSVCEKYKISPLLLLSESRNKPVPEARHICFFMLRKKGYSYQHIGNLFERHHASVMFGEKNIQQLLDINDKLVTSIINQIL